ncbi:hypothetical protein PG593_11155 [Riemerella anatipestifer]|uniref:hypothetical protein n=1 Tax=Riemerella anatipestifer TaxID=34085 RepID=UPI00069CB0A7|nr:hypothetical protein [Riemerella anatipestifer]MDY3345695.1 hypothetical protein [Riemerella anatipestifer]MDY3352380.1 hypothetical protein [Riemerella anatipestifer]MDY3358776.1 hypothetical protein [Riemerella anatipestifer]MDY3530327.1 hypothetical protein [Riemerella anatipestifer]MDY3538141.1 hypothetical protein [Riemerella anatipestifer]
MRKLTFLMTIILFGGILFQSCRKEDEQSKTLKSLIVGEWKVISYEISNFENSGETIDDTRGIVPRPIIIFNSDGTTSHTIFGSTRNLTYKLEADKLTFSQEIAFDHKEFECVISGNTLTLRRNDLRNHNAYSEQTKVVLERYTK